MLLVEHGKAFNNDVKMLRPAVKRALAGGEEGSELAAAMAAAAAAVKKEEKDM